MEELHQRVFEGLKRVNQDVREVARVFPPDRVCIELYNPGEGPFAGQDQRIKRAYIGS
jgi:phenylacetate-CoA ligase